MYGQGSDYRQWIVGMLHYDRQPTVRVGVIDVGSFTTDLACIVVNLQTEVADGITTVAQHSWEHGIINLLDKPVLIDVCSRHGVSWDAMRLSERELIKQQLYAGEPVTVPGATLGDAADLSVLDHGVAAFAQELCNKIRHDIESFQPEIAYLTGGGTRIAKIANDVAAFLIGNNCRVIPVPEADARSTLEPAERVATALGAASLILDAREPADMSAVPFPLPREQDYVTCRCQGGNKDCCFCWGRGSYRRVA